MRVHATKLTALTLVAFPGCAPPPAPPATPVGPGFECRVDLVNDTGSLVDVWYNPGSVKLGLMTEHETIGFTADCGHRVLSIYGSLRGALSEASEVRCASAEARLRPGETVMVFLNRPRVELC